MKVAENSQIHEMTLNEVISGSFYVQGHFRVILVTRKQSSWSSSLSSMKTVHMPNQDNSYMRTCT